MTQRHLSATINHQSDPLLCGIVLAGGEGKRLKHRGVT
jgi:hypothetical protein